MSKLNIAGKNKAEVLAKLYNASKPLGMGVLHFDPSEMTVDQAQEIIDKEGLRFDYLKGRVMKVNLEGDELSVSGFDRDNGQGAAERAING